MLTTKPNALASQASFVLQSYGEIFDSLDDIYYIERSHVASAGFRLE